MTASTNATAYATCFRLCRSARHHGNLHSACRAAERLGNRTVQSDRASDLGYALVRCSNRLYRLA